MSHRVAAAAAAAESPVVQKASETGQDENGREHKCKDERERFTKQQQQRSSRATSAPHSEQ